MATRDLAVGVIILSQTVLGVLGNFSLLCRYVLLHAAGCKARCTDLILRHLTVANVLVVLSNGVPQTLAAFGLRHSASDFRCSLLFFVRRVARNVSMESTCLLSVFQVITVSPQNSRWAALKGKAPKYTVPSTTLCWILNLAMNTIFPSVPGEGIDANITRKMDLGYCCAVLYNTTTALLFTAWLSFTDVFSLGLVLGASGSLVLILYRHKQRVRHIHTSSVSARSSAESRATQSVLLLVSTFVFFYTLSFICQLCLAFLTNASRLLVSLSAVFTMCFPALSPCVLLNMGDSTMSRPRFAWRR
ncbi:hypothetical protein PANDA_020963, partial [Ailuropoda melanoleuca]